MRKTKKKKLRGLVVYVIKIKKKIRGLFVFVIDEKKKKKKRVGRLCDQ